MKKALSVALPIGLCVSGLLGSLLIALGLYSGNLPGFPISQDKLLNFTLNMQLMILPISLGALGFSFLLNKENAKTFFRFGLGHVPAEGESDWRLIGPLLAVAFTIGSTLMMSMGVAAQGGEVNSYFWELTPLVLLVAFANAWTEEMVSRFVIVSGLYGKLSPVAICLISGSLFGLAHIRGTPSGLFGIIASGILGGFLAKSVLETKSMGWALLIHFLQDVVVFGAGAMVLAKGH